MYIKLHNMHMHVYIAVMHDVAKEVSDTVSAPVTKSGDTALGLAVREDKLGIIKYFVVECSVDSKGD